MSRSWEIEGGAAGIKGRKMEAFTHQYEFIRQGLEGAENILKEASCDPENISKVQAAQVVLQDLSPSRLKEKVNLQLQTALDGCKELGECRICLIGID